MDNLRILKYFKIEDVSCYLRVSSLKSSLSESERICYHILSQNNSEKIDFCLFWNFFILPISYYICLKEKNPPIFLAFVRRQYLPDDMIILKTTRIMWMTVNFIAETDWYTSLSKLYISLDLQVSTNALLVLVFVQKPEGLSQYFRAGF